LRSLAACSPRSRASPLSGWIKVEKDLANDPRVLRMASRLRHADVTLGSRSRLVVVGALVTLWWYADTHIRDDDTLPIGADQINELVGIDGFSDLMPDEWFVVLDANSVKLVDYTAHNGTTAKKRALGQRRKERSRIRHADVTPQSRVSHSNSVTRPRLDQDLDKTKTEESTKVAGRPRAATEPPEFLRLKLAYPQRSGSQPWSRALQAINARLREGHSWDEILDGTRRYADFCSATGKVGTEHVQQAARFCGPGKEFLQPWSLPVTKADNRLNANLSAADEFMRRTEPHDDTH
jgi:hypothetical protein